MDQLMRSLTGRTLEDAELVARCNMMMAAAGLVAKAQSAEDVLAICSSTSVFVAAFEELTGRRVPGVVRSPKSTADRTENCRLVVQSIARLFQLDLSHLDPQRIVSGDANQTGSLLELIVAIPKHKPDYPATRIEARQQTIAIELQAMQSRRVNGSNGSGGKYEWSPDVLVTRKETRKGTRDQKGKEESEGIQSDGWTSGSESSRLDSSGESRSGRGRTNHGRQQSEATDCGQRAPLRTRVPPAERFRNTGAPEHAAAKMDRFGRDSATRKGGESTDKFETEAESREETQSEHSFEREPATREGSESGDSYSSTSEHDRTNRFRFATSLPIAPDPREKAPPTRNHFRTTAGTLRHSAPPEDVIRQQGDVSRSDRVTSERQAAPEYTGRTGAARGEVSTRGGDVSTRKGDVNAVLSLVASVGREEDREWERKQAAFAGQLARLSRRAYAPRWPFRPLPDNVRRIVRQRPGVRDWVRAEEQRLQKRKKGLVPLRPRGSSRGSGALGLARCRKAYRGFLPAVQVPPETEPAHSNPAPLTDPDRLFSKQTLKQLNDAIPSPVSTLEGPLAKTLNLQTLLQKTPELRQLLIGPRGGIDGQSVRKLFDELPLNPGAKKGLAEKVAGLEAMKRGSGVRVNAEGIRVDPDEVNEEKNWGHVELWAEGIVPKTEPKMRALAQARLRGRLESHQQKRRQIQAERFKEEVVKDQKAAAVKRAEAEERLFKALLEKAVALEKEAILAQRKEARERTAAEQRNKQAEAERSEAEIRARCAQLKEEIQAKRREREGIERAQQQVMRQLAREERERLEMERAMLLERLALRST